ncbi:MAG: hypothetical protein ACRD8A_05520 [Candidatus Acidiferrales bacterium]
MSEKPKKVAGSAPENRQNTTDSLAGKPGKQLREGEKPSAPANLVIPKPVVIPAPPTNNSDKK